MSAADVSPTSGYAPVNGLEMYYEIHGTGQPLIMLHGGYGSIPGLGELVPRLAETRQVIGVELQGHGRTADVDRPLSYGQMADDVAGLMAAVGVEKADVFGVSMGGAVALHVAVRHPEVVRKLVVVAAGYNNDGFHPGHVDMMKMITGEMLAATPLKTEYDKLAPNPENFGTMVQKVGQLPATQTLTSGDIQAITAPTQLILGDSDVITLEHAVEMFRLRGGGVNGAMKGLPASQLAVLPATTHIGIMARVDLLTMMITGFLDAPMP